MTKSDTDKMRRWEVWQRDDGTTYLTWGTKATPTDSEKLVSTFYSANWLSAEREAFGSDPEIDAALGRLPPIEAFLRQRPDEPADYAETRQRLLALCG